MREQVAAKNAALRAKEAQMREQAKIQNYLQGKALLEAALTNANDAAWLEQADMSEAERHAAYVKSDSYKAYQANMAAWQKKQADIAWLENADKTEAERLADYKATPEYIKRAETWAAWDAEQERKKQSATWAAFRDVEKGSYTASQEKPWWEKAVDFIDNHQAGASIGLGAGVGLAAVVITLAVVGAVTWPVLLVAAGVATVAAGVAVATGTVALNTHYGRPPETNLWNNVKVGATTAAAVAGMGLFLAGGLLTSTVIGTGNAIASACAANPVACAKAGAALNLIDPLEELVLTGQLFIETATGNPRAGETAIELQLEKTDGGAPGNTVFVKTQQLISRNTDEVAGLINKYGDNALDLLETQNLTPDEVAELSKLPGNATELADDVLSKIGTHYKDNPLRVEYENKVTDLNNQLQKILEQNNGVVTEVEARFLSQARRDLGVEYKNMTLGPLRDYIYELNSTRYGDPLGPDWDFLMEKYDGDYLAIAKAATNPNKDINNLLSGFADWLKKKDLDYLLGAELRILRRE